MDLLSNSSDNNKNTIKNRKRKITKKMNKVLEPSIKVPASDTIGRPRPRSPSKLQNQQILNRRIIGANWQNSMINNSRTTTTPSSSSSSSSATIEDFNNFKFAAQQFNNALRSQHKKGIKV